jgi:hypothetical protein
MHKIAISIIFFCFAIVSFSQEKTNESLKIYLDCNNCDNTFIKQNLGHVQFVRDQSLGDVHLFFVNQRNGSGGRQYEVDFIGKHTFETIHYKITFSTDSNMTGDDVRKRILEYIKLGLVRFWIEKGALEGVSVSVPSPETGEESTEKVKDPWNFWVFGAGASSYLNGQESSKSSRLNFNVSAKRVTEKNKFSFRIGFNENKSTFTFDGEDIVSINNRKSLNVSDVLSINDHWSYGVFANLGTSTFSNYKAFWALRPAIEYNFLPTMNLRKNN